MGKYGFSKEDRLRRAFEFERVRSRGERRRTNHLSFCVWRRDDSPLRLGISVGRGVGGAVKRNWLKRRIREFFRLNRQAFGFSGDVIVSGLGNRGLVRGTELAIELKKGFQARGGRGQV